MAEQAQIDQPGEKAGKYQDPSAPAAEDLSYGDEDIDFEGTPWVDDIWQDNEALVMLKDANIVIGKTLCVSDCSHITLCSMF